MRTLAIVLLLLVGVPLLAALLLALLDLRPASLRSTYRRAVRDASTRRGALELVQEEELTSLPAPVATYLRRAGVVDRPRVRRFHAVLTSEMRAGPDAAWFPARADQHEFFAPAERLFFMRARRGGVPFDVLHHYAGDGASMRVRVAGLVTVVDLSGSTLALAETVTLLNDMCVLAPAALLDADVEWEPVDARMARVTFTNAGYVVHASLHFDDAGDLVDFRSDDRWMLDGHVLRRLPWSTPLSDYADFGGVRLARRGEAQWTQDGRTWSYGRFVLQRLEYGGS